MLGTPGTDGTLDSRCWIKVFLICCHPSTCWFIAFWLVLLFYRLILLPPYYTKVDSSDEFFPTYEVQITDTGHFLHQCFPAVLKAQPIFLEISHSPSSSTVFQFPTVGTELWAPSADWGQGFVHVQDLFIFSGQGVWILFPEGTRVCTDFWTKFQINPFCLQALLSSSLVDYLLKGIQTYSNKKMDGMRTVKIIPPTMRYHGNNQNNSCLHSAKRTYCSLFKNICIATDHSSILVT